MIGFDTLHAAETLTDAGIDATHAKAIVAALSEAVGEPITKADLEPLATRAELQQQIAGVRADLQPLATKAELQQQIAGVRADLQPLATKAELEPFATKADLEAAIQPLATKAELERLATKVELERFATKADLRAEISELKATLTWRIVLALGAFAALVRLMP